MGSGSMEEPRVVRSESVTVAFAGGTLTAVMTDGSLSVRFEDRQSGELELLDPNLHDCGRDPDEAYEAGHEDGFGDCLDKLHPGLEEMHLALHENYPFRFCTKEPCVALLE